MRDLKKALLGIIEAGPDEWDQPVKMALVREAHGDMLLTSGFYQPPTEPEFALFGFAASLPRMVDSGIVTGIAVSSEGFLYESAPSDPDEPIESIVARARRTVPREAKIVTVVMTDNETHSVMKFRDGGEPHYVQTMYEVTSGRMVALMHYALTGDENDLRYV